LPTAQPRDAGESQRGRDIVAVVTIAAVALAASIAGIANDFAFDDLHLVRDNVRIQDLASWPAWFTSSFWPPPYSQDLYRPLTSLLMAVEYVIGAGAPLAFRVASYVLYALCAVSVYRFASRLLPRPFALGAALLFAAHPVHVEAVALAVGQSELAAAILIMMAATRYLDRRRNAAGMRRRDWLLITAAYAAASLVKEQGLLLPAFLLLVEAYFIESPTLDGVREGVRQRVRALLPGYAGLAAVCVVVLAARRVVLGDLAGTFTAEALIGLGAGGRALTMLRVVPQWIRLLYWPAHLQADYSPREIVASGGIGGVEVLGLACVAAALALWWYTRRRAPVVSFGIAWTALALLPVSNVLVATGIVLAERTLLLPSVGATLALVAGACAFARWFVARRGEQSGSLRRPPWAVCTILVALGIGRSAERQRVWRNDAIFIARGVQDAPVSFRMQQSYGELLFELHFPKLANEAYARALEYVPPSSRWRVRNDYARALGPQGDFAAKAEQLAASIAAKPDQDVARGEFIGALLTLGRYEEAGAQADSALAHGAPATVFRGLRIVADSAARVHAAPGSIVIALHTGAFAPSR
jgi:hypothetical protein